MRFEERELKPYAEPVSASDLKEGSVYFSVGFVDDEMLIPVVKTLVFIGRNLQPTDVGQLYFQDVVSYGHGLRYPGGDAYEGVAEFHRITEGQSGFAFEYEAALNQLLSCSLRRRAKAGAETDGFLSETTHCVERGGKAQRYIRFDDAALQQAFVRELERGNVRYTTNSGGEVAFDKAGADAVVEAAHRVRDAQFPWYFVMCETDEQFARFRTGLLEAGLPFFVERHESGTVLVVRRADRKHLDSLFQRVL